MVKSKDIEIFCGTGGVGKTTLATSRALYLANHGKRVLLITIDPSKRLKQVLNLPDDDSGNTVSVKNLMPELQKSDTFHLDALLLSPWSTMKRMGIKTGTVEEFTNPVIRILTRPNGGMNEIMATIEVQHHLEVGDYDTVVLDTPPGKHFLDFLESSRKIQKFFDKSFIEIFKYLGKSINKIGSESSMPKRIIGKIVSTGVKKLLTYLEKVTGPDFVNTFVDAIIVIYKNRDQFLKALQFQESLNLPYFSNWFLVTSVEHVKVSEAISLKTQVEHIMHADSFLVVNKCLEDLLESWQPEEQSELSYLKKSLIFKEKSLLESSHGGFQSILTFPDIFDSNPQNHVINLAQSWEKYEFKDNNQGNL